VKKHPSRDREAKYLIVHTGLQRERDHDGHGLAPLFVGTQTLVGMTFDALSRWGWRHLSTLKVLALAIGQPVFRALTKGAHNAVI
jgi:hypothetical protein